MTKKYNIDTMSFEDLKKLIEDGDDTHDNQIRVSKAGEVFLSQDIVGANDLEDIAFRFETFDAGDDFVGKSASEDIQFVTDIYNALKYNWKNNSSQTYIDDWKINREKYMQWF